MRDLKDPKYASVVELPFSSLIFEEEGLSGPRRKDLMILAQCMQTTELWPPFRVKPHPTKDGLYSVVVGVGRCNAIRHFLSGNARFDRHPCIITGGRSVSTHEGGITCLQGEKM